MSTDELHFVVKAFGVAVVAGEAPHGYDFSRVDWAMVGRWNLMLRLLASS